MDVVYNKLVYKHTLTVKFRNDASKQEPFKTWRTETMTEIENIEGSSRMMACYGTVVCGDYPEAEHCTLATSCREVY